MTPGGDLVVFSADAAAEDWGYTPLFIVNADGTGLSVVPGIDKAFEPSWRPE